MARKETELSAVGLRIDAEPTGEDPLELPPGYLRERVLGHRLLVLRGFRVLSADDLVALARAFEPAGAQLLEWPWGPVMDVQIRDDAVNYLFSRQAVPFHWDGFFAREPSYLVFQCVQPPAGGGATLFADAAKVWDLADDARRGVWATTVLTYATEKKAHYGGVASISLVRRHPVTGRTTLRYAEPVATDLNPLSVTSDDMSASDLAALVDDLRARLYEPRVCQEHVWREGDLVIADNQALLHGRAPIAGSGARHLRRVQIL